MLMRLADVAQVRDVAVDLANRTVTVAHEGSTEGLLAALSDLDLGAVLIDVQEVAAADGGPSGAATGQRRALLVALVINVAFFAGELSFGLVSGSMGLVADSLDMLADASVYALSLVAVGLATIRQKRLAAASGYVQLGLAVLGLTEVLRRVIWVEAPPDAVVMAVVAGLALLANVFVLWVLRRARGEAAHLQAAWIFTSNDIKVNAMVIAAALLVAATGSNAPDLVAGGLIFVVVANGARRILRLSR